jgi:hypothetical protein
MATDPSPSAARRKALRQADGKNDVFKVMETVSVDKYYYLIDRLLVEFDRAMDERRLDEAYIYGIRFASFSVESLPRHVHYKSPEYKRLQLRNARQVDRVLKGLESVTARMDAEELAKTRRDEEKQVAPRENKVETQKRQRESEQPVDIFEKDSRRRNVQQSALAKLQALQVESDRDIAKQEAKARAQEEAVLDRERKSIAEQAVRLAQQEREKQDEQQCQDQKKEATATEVEQRRARSEEEAAMEKEPKRIAKEAAEHLAQQQQISLEEKPGYMLSREYETIQLLEQTIEKQEARLILLERGMAKLLHEAKMKHHAGERKAAIHCMARRKRLECNMEAVKGAIFTMETQILMMEAAASDRQVSKAMKAASQAMESLHANVGDEVFVFDGNQTMDEIAQIIANDVMYDEDDLLSELEASTHVADVAADADLLSLPSLPTNKVPETRPEERKAEPTKLVRASLF